MHRRNNELLFWTSSQVLRRALIGAVLLGGLLAVVGCGGATSRLVTVRPAGTQKSLSFEVKNKSSTTVNSFYLAPTADIEKAPRGHAEPGSAAEAETWGPDLLDDALPEGKSIQLDVPQPGRWDARATDRYGGYQHVSGLRLEAGGSYILELNDGGWRRY